MLVAAIDKGSLSAAARELQIPLPTLSRKVAELETQVGAQLLKRTTRQLTLTEAGAAYVASARRILDLVGQQEREAAGEFTTPRGDLVITAPLMFTRLLLMPVVLEFLSEYSEINVTLLQSDAIVDLVGENVDLAVRLGKLPDSGLIATKIGATRVVVCGSPDLLTRLGKPGRPADLAGMPSITLTGPIMQSRWQFREPASGEPLVVEVAPRLRMVTGDAAVDAAMLGFGMTRLLHYQVADALDAGKLAAVLEDHEAEPLPIHLVHVSRGQMPLKLRSFLDFAVPRLRKSLLRFQATGRGKQAHRHAAGEPRK